jgi:ribonuclease HI
MNIDGAARGNPGPASYAVVVSEDGQIIEREKGCLGETTNNVAEYTGLLKALEKAIARKAQDVLIRSDSELLVKQMSGEYRVKNEKLKTLYEEAVSLKRQLPSVRISHVRREENAEADRLCNEALDGKASCRETKSPAESKNPWNELQQEIATILRGSSSKLAAGKIVESIRRRGFAPPAS